MVGEEKMTQMKQLEINCLIELYRPLYFKGYVKFMKMSIFLLNFLILGKKYMFIY